MPPQQNSSVLFGFGVYEPSGRTIVPLAGMVVGNSLAATVLDPRAPHRVPPGFGWWEADGAELAPTNGVDDAVWNPATDSHIVAQYSADDLSGKRENRVALLDRAGLEPGQIEHG